jgi:protein-tyrosine phosphatase
VGDLHGFPGPTRWGMRIAAARTSLLLSVLFLVIYCGANWITSRRTDVGTWYSEWELAIPFVPLMIVPYMSIDLFFVAAPFLCSGERELRTLSKRVSFAIVAAGICFLLLPLHTAFEKPEVEGWLGAVFQGFLGLDKPYNLVPSLHITLRAILVDLYARHTRGLVRGAVHVWFCLIGFSTVLTHQHHIVDVLGGFVLAGFCFYLFREAINTLPGTRNLRIALYYGLGAVAALALAWATWPWGSLLLWPAVGTGIVTTAYCGLGPGIYRKSAGLLPLSTRFVLGPLLLGQYASLLYYRRQCRPWDEVAPGLLMGRRLSDYEATEAVRQGVTAVLDLTAEFSEAAPFRAMNYRNLPILDLTAPTPEQMREAAQFIGQEIATGKVYVHCKIGYSRSAAIVGGYLLASRKAATAQEAVEHLRKVRPSIIVRTEAIEALRTFEGREIRSGRA